jgi:hypothetical protein
MQQHLGLFGRQQGLTAQTLQADLQTLTGRQRHAVPVQAAAQRRGQRRIKAHGLGVALKHRRLTGLGTAGRQGQRLSDGAAQKILRRTYFIEPRAVALSLGHGAVGPGDRRADHGQQHAEQTQHHQNFEQRETLASARHCPAPEPALRTCRLL